MLQILKNSFFGPIIFIFSYLILPILFVNIYDFYLINKFVTYIIILTILITISELLFTYLYKKKYSKNYTKINKIPFKLIKVEPHPNLPFIHKKNYRSDPIKTNLNYPLHDQFKSPTFNTNNLGYVNGFDGGRDIQIPKPKNLFRINCLGASTTQNCLEDKGKVYSYPLILEEILKKKYDTSIEVNNCGTGGYTSADILVRFLLQNIDTDPNIVVLYHAYNDIRSYLTDDFQSDYTHSRKNLGENYFKFHLGSLIPDIPLNFINFFLNKWSPQNHRYALIDSISKGEVNLDNDKNIETGILTFKRNLQNLISVCKSKKIEIILCSFSFYLHEKVKDDRLHKLYEKLVMKENLVIKKLAEENGVNFIDIYNLIPKKDINFLDTIHLTPSGMEILAREISKKIIINSNK